MNIRIDINTENASDLAMEELKIGIEELIKDQISFQHYETKLNIINGDKTLYLKSINQ